VCNNCHVVTVKVKVNSLTALDRACKRLGWKFSYGEEGFQTVTYWADDSPVPREIFATQHEFEKVCGMDREQRSKIMQQLLQHPVAYFRAPGRTHDCGVFAVGDTFTVTLDWWMDRGRAGAAQQVESQLAQAYGVEAAIEQAERNCQSYTETLLEDGSIQINVSVQE
jgi:hypothetical protein